GATQSAVNVSDDSAAQTAPTSTATQVAADTPATMATESTSSSTTSATPLAGTTEKSAQVATDAIAAERATLPTGDVSPSPATQTGSENQSVLSSSPAPEPVNEKAAIASETKENKGAGDAKDNVGDEQVFYSLYMHLSD